MNAVDTNARGDDLADRQLAAVKSAAAPDLAPRRPASHLLLTGLIVPCLACDFLMMPAFGLIERGSPELGVPIVTGSVGCVLAQGCLLAAFLAWSSGPFLPRLATHWIIAAGLYLVWLAGVLLAPPDPAAPQMAVSVALGVPLVSLGAQFPLWLARQFWGWRLVRDDREGDPHPAFGQPLPEGEGQDDPLEAHFVADRKLSIRDLLLATLIVAIALALARLAPLDGKDKDGGPVWLVACVVASVISSITLLPAGKLLLRARVLRRGLLWSILYAAAWISLVWIIATVQWWFALPRAPRPIYVGISSFMFTFASTLILTSLLARSHGYGLTGGGKRASASARW